MRVEARRNVPSDDPAGRMQAYQGEEWCRWGNPIHRSNTTSVDQKYAALIYITLFPFYVLTHINS